MRSRPRSSRAANEPSVRFRPAIDLCCPHCPTQEHDLLSKSHSKSHLNGAHQATCPKATSPWDERFPLDSNLESLEVRQNIVCRTCHRVRTTTCTVEEIRTTSKNQNRCWQLAERGQNPNFCMLFASFEFQARNVAEPSRCRSLSKR